PPGRRGGPTRADLAPRRPAPSRGVGPPRGAGPVGRAPRVPHVLQLSRGGTRSRPPGAGGLQPGLGPGPAAPGALDEAAGRGRDPARLPRLGRPGASGPARPGPARRPSLSRPPRRATV